MISAIGAPLNSRGVKVTKTSVTFRNAQQKMRLCESQARNVRSWPDSAGLCSAQSRRLTGVDRS